MSERTERGLFLVELLVVISIIALLLPALVNVKETAQSFSRMHSISIEDRKSL